MGSSSLIRNLGFFCLETRCFQPWRQRKERGLKTICDISEGPWMKTVHTLHPIDQSEFDYMTSRNMTEEIGKYRGEA